MNEIKIEDRSIGINFKPFIIAEMSGNHNQSLDRALKIVEAAALAGADALKLQTYTADTMTLNVKRKEFFIDDKNSLWNGNYLYDLYSQAYTPWEWHGKIKKYANKLGMICFSTPFDIKSLEFLESLDMPAYKIASFENNHLHLIKKVALTGKPIIISTGMATISELEEVIKTIKSAGSENYILLKCTSSYPATPLDSNVITISHMKELFNCQIGLSDHTMGIGASLAAVAHGATIIEKHFTLDRMDGGVDSAFSLEPEELKSLVVESKRAWQSLGKISYGPSKEDQSSVQYRRSLFITKEIKKGEILTEDHLGVYRPCVGLAPKYYNIVLGKKVNQDLVVGMPITWEIF